MSSKKQSGKIAAAVSSARTAFRQGDLDQYKPLAATGTKGVEANCPTSWGPAMRR